MTTQLEQIATKAKVDRTLRFTSFANQAQDDPVCNTVRHHPHQPLMIDVVKVSADVGLVEMPHFLGDQCGPQSTHSSISDRDLEADEPARGQRSGRRNDEGVRTVETRHYKISRAPQARHRCAASRANRWQLRWPVASRKHSSGKTRSVQRLLRLARVSRAHGSAPG
jgi:hypothetical protein